MLILEIKLILWYIVDLIKVFTWLSLLILLSTVLLCGTIPLMSRLRVILRSAHRLIVIEFSTTMTLLAKSFAFARRMFWTTVPTYTTSASRTLLVPATRSAFGLTLVNRVYLPLIVSRYCLESSSLWIVPSDTWPMLIIVANVVSSFISLRRSSCTWVLLLWVRKRNFMISSDTEIAFFSNTLKMIVKILLWLELTGVNATKSIPQIPLRFEIVGESFKNFIQNIFVCSFSKC